MWMVWRRISDLYKLKEKFLLSIFREVTFQHPLHPSPPIGLVGTGRDGGRRKIFFSFGQFWLTPPLNRIEH
jgi:hypothetical protein